MKIKIIIGFVFCLLFSSCPPCEAPPQFSGNLGATSIKSAGALGDWICYTAINADDWYVRTYGTWAE